MRTEALPGFGVARHRKPSLRQAFVYPGQALGDMEQSYSRAQGSQAWEGRKWASQRRLEEFPKAEKVVSSLLLLS